jgi:hypothetical protein
MTDVRRSSRKSSAAPATGAPRKPRPAKEELPYDVANPEMQTFCAPAALREAAPPCTHRLDPRQSSSAHYLAARFGMRTHDAARRCSRCYAPTSATEVWRALSELSFLVRRDMITGEEGPGTGVAFATTPNGRTFVSLVVVDAFGNVVLDSDGSEIALVGEPAWQFLWVDVAAANPKAKPRPDGSVFRPSK